MGAKRRLKPTMSKTLLLRQPSKRATISASSSSLQAKRLFAEDVLAGFQRGQHLCGMQVMASGDDYGVHGGILEIVSSSVAQ